MGMRPQTYTKWYGVGTSVCKLSQHNQHSGGGGSGRNRMEEQLQDKTPAILRLVQSITGPRVRRQYFLGPTNEVFWREHVGWAVIGVRACLFYMYNSVYSLLFEPGSVCRCFLIWVANQ